MSTPSRSGPPRERAAPLSSSSSSSSSSPPSAVSLPSSAPLSSSASASPTLSLYHAPPPRGGLSTQSSLSSTPSSSSSSSSSSRPSYVSSTPTAAQVGSAGSGQRRFFKAAPPPALPPPPSSAAVAAAPQPPQPSAPSPAPAVPSHSRSSSGSGAPVTPLRGVNGSAAVSAAASLIASPAPSLRGAASPASVAHAQSTPAAVALAGSSAQVTPFRPPSTLPTSNSSSALHPVKALSSSSSPHPLPSSGSASASSHPAAALSSAYPSEQDETMRRRKMLIHSTTTTIQSTSITEQGLDASPNSALSYYVHMNGGKADDAASSSHSLSPVLHASGAFDKPKERMAAEGFTSRRKRAGGQGGAAQGASLEDGSLGKDGAASVSAHVREHLTGHHPSLWWRVRERSQRAFSPFARLVGWKSFDVKKSDEDDGYFSASSRKPKPQPQAQALQQPQPHGHSPGTNGKRALDKSHKAHARSGCARAFKYLVVAAVLLASLSVLSSFIAGFSLGLPLPAYLLSMLRSSPSSSPSSDAAVALPASGTPYTIISLLHDMNSAFESEHRDGYIFQFNAIRSWLRLVPPSHIILYMDTQASCDHLTGLVAEFRDIRCQPVPCVNEEFHRPRLDCLFNHANENAVTDIIAFVNGDIVLDPYLNTVLDSVRRQYGQHFSLVSRRTDTQVDMATMDAWYASIHRSDHTDAVIRYAAERGSMHSEWGIDLFVYTRTVFATLDFPPFLAGVYRWDNWLLTTLILKDDMYVVDATKPGMVIHQQSDAKGPPHPERHGHEWNDRIVKTQIGSLYKIGHILNANTIVRGQCPDCTITHNPNISLHVHLAKYQHPSMWVSIIPVAGHQVDDAYAARCYYDKLGLKHYFFLARDDTAYQALSKANANVVGLQQAVPDAVVVAKSKAGYASLLEHEFFHAVQRLNYNFLYIDVGGLVLTDPVDWLSNTEADVMIKKQTVGTTVLNNEFTSSIYSIRSSTQAQFYWNQVKNCRLSNDAQSDAKLHVDCVAQQFTKVGGQLKKGFLDHFLFPDMGLALVDRWPQLNGYYPLVLVSNATLSANPVARRDLLRQWKLTASAADSPAECHIVHPPLFSPPTQSKQTEFSLKIRVLTFDRHASLSRLLTSLNDANYEGDASIVLEIAIDLPANLSHAEVVERNTRTLQVAQAFQWRHGPSSVLQQTSHKGLVGQWTTGWQPAPSNTEVLLVLEDDTAVSPHFYIWTKRMIQTYYLDPAQYDPRMFGFALQLQHTILGETLKERYGSRKVRDLVPSDTPLYRYQLVGTWGGVFFPQHWREFVTWLREKQFQPAQGTSNLPVPFKPCVPGVLSNDWWQNKTQKVWSQWFIRFAYEQGWYNVYTNFPVDEAQASPAFDSNQTSLVANYREAGDNFNRTKGMMNPITLTLTPDMLAMPPLRTLPLFDFHFHRVSEPALLSLRNAIYHEQHIPQCWTMREFLRKRKEQEEYERVQEDKRKLKAENKRRQQLGLKPLSSLAQLNPPPPKPPAPPQKKSNPLANAAKAAQATPPAPVAPVAAPPVPVVVGEAQQQQQQQQPAAAPPSLPAEGGAIVVSKINGAGGAGEAVVLVEPAEVTEAPVVAEAAPVEQPGGE